MQFFNSKASRLFTGLAASALLMASYATQAQTVSLTAAPTTTTLPDGQVVPMWGYQCGTGAAAAAAGATCAAANPLAGASWSPVVITVPYTGSTTSLTVTLTNNLTFTAGATTNTVPTSLTIVGQLGGGLGSGGTTSASPVHTGAPGITWPTPDPTTPSTPTAQLPRVQSFGTEVAAGASVSLCWGTTCTVPTPALRPGTYLIESGTHPSIQGPMGLYGILVVTTPATGTTAATAAQAYPSVNGVPATAAASTYDADVPVVLSEIDPVQNASVAAAVTTAGFGETTVWSGQPGGCGNPTSASFNTCYPPAVNYSPRYYLVNGVSFDRTAIASSTLAPAALVPAATAAVAAPTGNVLVRLVNAGLRMHVPAMVGLPFTLIAEDGNPLPGVPRIQNEVFMAAGKTYDVVVKPAQTTGTTNYTAASYPLFDRQLSLSTNNQRDGGMQAYVAVAGGAATGIGSQAGSGVVLTGTAAKTFYCVSGTTLSVTDPAAGLLGGTSGANGVALTATGGLTGLVVQSDGTFTYTPPATGSCGGSFTYLINNATQLTSQILECDAAAQAAGSGTTSAACTLGRVPTLAPDSFTGTNAKILTINPPGVLLNDTDPSGLKLAVDPATIVPTGSTTLTSLTVNPDGSFSAVAPGAGTYTFTYNVLNSQKSAAAAPATVTLVFPTGSGLAVNLIDQKVPTRTISDYRWIIEEDRTFWIDPKCQVNITRTATGPKDSYGRLCPPTPVEALGYNFHSAGMPVVATGCVGAVSCESGQTLLGQAAVCDVGDGACRVTANGDGLFQRLELNPSQVALDPNKHYFISVMPGDGINPTTYGSWGASGVAGSVTYTNPAGKQVTRQFDPAIDCPADSDFAPGSGKCGHNMGGAQIGPQFLPDGTPVTKTSTPAFGVTIKLAQTPLPTAKIAVLVYQDDYPLNGENDAGGGVDILAPNEAGLGGFQIELLDQAGGLGDNTGQITYDMFNMPVSNALAGTPDPMNGMQDACPLTPNADHITGMIVTCPTYEADNKTKSPLAGQAVITNLYPGLYEISAFPAADRIARGEEWLQTNTLDGGKPHEAFIRPGEPAYFQEFGPGGFHVQIGFANPKIINDRRSNNAGTGICDAVATGGGGLTCNSTVKGQVHGNHMSRTPDERTYDTGDYSAFQFSQCYVSLGVPDEQDFAFTKCDQDGSFTLPPVPAGTYKIAVFDQWNDIMLDGLITAVTTTAGATTTITPTATQWRTNLYTRTYLDLNGNGIPDRDGAGNDLEPGAPLIPINIRYRDGSKGFANTTDLNGYATYNEVFPFMNWLVVEPDSVRYKPTGQHVVYDAGGADDCSPNAMAAGLPCSKTAANLAGTSESNSVPQALRVPGAVYCTDADCILTQDSIKAGPYYTTGGSSGPASGLSSGRIDPPWKSEAWQGLLGQHSFIDFGMKPFVKGETGGIQGLVVYGSTRPFDDPGLDVQLTWEPAVPNVQVNLYKESIAADGEKTLTLVDTTYTSSWDKWAQGFRTTGDGKTPLLISGTNNDAAKTAFTNAYVPNMNCPGQDPTSGFFATLAGSKMWLDQKYDATTGSLNPSAAKNTIAYNSQFKCFDGWSMLNQIQPAPYDGKYVFPSTVDLDPVSGRPSGQGYLNGVATPLAGTNCSICVKNPVDPLDPTPMLPAGKYVVEVITPPGFEIVKEEDKNILMGDIYIAPVTQQFAGLGNIFILPDQAAINAYYNANNVVNPTTNLGVVNERSDFATTDQMWPCVGATRIVPDYMSLFPAVQQTAPFAGASRPLCDRKEVQLDDQMSASAKFYVYTKNHIAGHFVGGMTNDMASEFDPFSPQFGEKFGVPNLPVRMRDFVGDEVTRVYGDQWGAYNGLYFSSWEVNPPNPTGYAPQMSVACMNDPGPILDTDPTSATHGQMITDPAYNPAYSNFCYETPFMPGFTAYMDTPVTPVQAFADHYNLPDAEYPDGTPMIKRSDFTGYTGPWAPTAATPLVLQAYGDRTVQNPQFAGPSANAAPYNLKTITRHYGFGARCTAPTATSATCNTVSSVTIGGKAATVTGWSDPQITVTPPTGLPACALQQIGAPSTALCGEVVITAGNGKQSIDGITVTVGGKPPTVVTPSSATSTAFGEFYPNPLQTAIDKASPGDLIIVNAGAYRENLIMWKPVRLQGVGAGVVTINADAQPAGKMDAWRRRVSCLFGLTLQGVPNPGNSSYDPSGQYACPAAMYFRSDRLPFEGFVGWDASSNGNLAQVLQEPSLMGAYEGAGVTVLGRGVNQNGVPVAGTDLWGQIGGAGTYADGSVYVNGSNAAATQKKPAGDCRSASTAAVVTDYGTANFLCNPSAIDGLSIINSSQGGGGIFLHAWNHNLQIANNRISANAGTLSGAINLGNGETPPAYTIDGVTCGVAGVAVAPLCPPIPAGTLAGAQIPFQFNTNVHVHHNQILNNASIGDALFSGSPAGAGGVTVSAGSDNYQLDHNWIAANLTSSDGGGVAHMGVSFNGKINNNFVLFNQANNPTLPVDGGGIIIMGAQEDRTLTSGPSAGQECGGSTDLDCPPGMGDGTGPGLVIDSNLILGNSAEDGSGGGLRLRQTNGTEVAAFPKAPKNWYGITVTNNIIVNNVAGWDGGGVSLQDSFKTSLVNNTIASNDTTASAGVLFKTLGAVNAASPPPGCIPTPDPTQPQDPSCDSAGNGPHMPQPAGLVTMQNTPNMMAQYTGDFVCPAGFGYGDANDSLASLTNGRCLLVSLPKVVNDIFWQNRAFHVEIVDSAGNTVVGTSTANGTGLASHQNIVALRPLLTYAGSGTAGIEVSTGQCGTPPSAEELYWDMGVRMDSNSNSAGHLLVFNQAAVPSIYNSAPGKIPAVDVGPVALSATNSIFTDSHNALNATTVKPVIPTTSPVVGQYCNGARIPPEQCSSQSQGANNSGLCQGYFTPAGQSETAGVSPVFVFNGITATATVDEGNNWINMVFGPLTLSRTTATSLTGGNASTELLVSAPSPSATVAPIAASTAAYTPSSGIVEQGTPSGAPTTDFFGQARSTTKPSIGAVETKLPPPVTLTASVTPSPVAFGTTVVVGTTSTLAVTVSNTGTTALAGGTFTLSGAPFSRATGGGAGSCGAALAVGASCTVNVVFAPTLAQAYTGSLTVAYTGATVTPTPVSLTGTGVAAVRTATLTPTTKPYGNATRGVGAAAAPTQVFTLTNTGNVTLTGITQGVLGGTNPAEFSVVRLTSTCGPGGGGQLLGQTTLAPGAACVVTVQFRPLTAQTTGAKSATISVTDLAGTQTSTLSGTAQ